LEIFVVDTETTGRDDYPKDVCPMKEGVHSEIIVEVKEQ